MATNTGHKTSAQGTAFTKYSLIGPSEASHVEDLLAEKGDKEARQRLQALIAEWLRMENVVVLTGAGCSYSSGGKLLAGLEKTVSETVLETSDLDYSAKALLQERLTSDKDGPAWVKSGFEDWLSYLSNAAYLASSDESPFAGPRVEGFS
jgi:hypothetical protein